MNTTCSYHKVLWTLATFAVAFSLLFTGMRVPDIARPHRPKPSQRAIIENQVKTSQDAVKKATDPVAVAGESASPPATIPCRVEFISNLPPIESSPLFPKSSRAPPATLS